MRNLIAETKEICRLFAINPERSKGQNFLISSQIYDDIVSAADLSPSDEILEVGPGLGFLTVRLIKQAKRVVAVELDKDLFTYLQTGLKVVDNSKIELINQDILRFNPAEKFFNDYKVVANLPYNITSIFLRSFLSCKQAPQVMVLMLQQEVAIRIVAKPPKMSLLAVSVQHYSQAEIVRLVEADNFWPRPRVDSALIKLVIKKKKFSQQEDKEFFRLVKIGFSAKRKMLRNNLAGGLQLNSNQIISAFSKTGISKQARAENLSLENWYRLFATLSKFML
jgi:16S rRNA (adenine1518-N6/adenine1519-N6)-dimethyltransferase